MRHFTERTRTQLTRKPYGLAECSLVEFHGEDLANIPLITFSGGIRGLNHEIESLPGVIECAALDSLTGHCYLVNTEGATYARYAGLLARRDANALYLESEGEVPTICA